MQMKQGFPDTAKWGAREGTESNMLQMHGEWKT